LKPSDKNGKEKNIGMGPGAASGNWRSLQIG